jgi:hypothetical protein
MELPRLFSAPPMAPRDRRALHLVGAIAALLLISGLILRGSVGLYGDGKAGIVDVDPDTGAVLGGRVQLIPGSTTPIFQDVELMPGDRATGCFELLHRGDVPLESVVFTVQDPEGSSDLLGLVELEVERGTARAEGCDGFVADTSTSGPLDTFGESSTRDGWRSWQPYDGENAVYRFTLRLPEDVTNDLQGAIGSMGVRWVATAEPTGGDLGSRLMMLLAEVARDALIPLLILLVVAAIFLGIQDRIDRRDPKLALAAVVEEPEPFLDPSELVPVGVVGQRELQPTGGPW